MTIYKQAIAFDFHQFQLNNCDMYISQNLPLCMRRYHCNIYIVILNSIAIYTFSCKKKNNNNICSHIFLHNLVNKCNSLFTIRAALRPADCLGPRNTAQCRSSVHTWHISRRAPAGKIIAHGTERGTFPLVFATAVYITEHMKNSCHSVRNKC